MNSARSILTKEIWSRRTDKRILWFVQRCVLLVLIVWAAFYIAVRVMDFVSVRWFTAAGRKQTQELLDQSVNLRTASSTEILQSYRSNDRVNLNLDTALNLKLEFQGQFLLSDAGLCRLLELQLLELAAEPRRARLNAQKNKKCGLYEQEAQSLREALKTTPTFRF